MTSNTGNGSDFRNVECFADLGHAFDGLFDLGCKKPLHGGFNVFDGFIDDAIGSNLDGVLVGEVSCFGIRGER